AGPQMAPQRTLTEKRGCAFDPPRILWPGAIASRAGAHSAVIRAHAIEVGVGDEIGTEGVHAARAEPSSLAEHRLHVEQVARQRKIERPSRRRVLHVEEPAERHAANLGDPRTRIAYQSSKEKGHRGALLACRGDLYRRLPDLRVGIRGCRLELGDPVFE